MRGFIVLLVITSQVVAFAPPAQAQEDIKAYLLSKINELRASRGLNPLAINAQLAAAAQAHSNYLASTVYTHPHRERDGSLPQDRAAAAGYGGRVSENVVGGIGASPEWAFNWWLQSGTHHRNMLGDWTEIGIGFADGGEYGRWYTTVFGNAGRPPLPSEGYTGVNPASGPAAESAPPRPTRPPPPTSTPTATYTPSITYTPRPTFTPTLTRTPLPPTPTAIVLEISPQPTGGLSPTPEAASASSPTPPSSATPALIAAVPSPEALPAPDAVQPAASSPNMLRSLLPWAIALQGLIIGGLVVSAILRRRR